MKFVHGLLLGTGAAFGLGCAARFIYDKIIEAKIYKDYTKALEDFMTFKSDKEYIKYNLIQEVNEKGEVIHTWQSF